MRQKGRLTKLQAQQGERDRFVMTHVYLPSHLLESLKELSVTRMIPVSTLARNAILTQYGKELGLRDEQPST